MAVAVAVAVLKPKAGQAGCGVAHPLLHLKVRMRKRSCAMLLLRVSVQVLLASLPLEPLHSLQRHADWDGIAFDQREPVWARSVRACKPDNATVINPKALNPACSGLGRSVPPPHRAPHRPIEPREYPTLLWQVSGGSGLRMSDNLPRIHMREMGADRAERLCCAE